MGAICSNETPGFLRNTRRYNQEGRILQQERHKLQAQCHAWNTCVDTGLDRGPEIITRDKEANKWTWYIPPQSRARYIRSRPKIYAGTPFLNEVCAPVQYTCPGKDYQPTYLPTYLPIYLSINLSTALVDLRRFFSFLIRTQSVGLLGRGIRQSQGHYLYTEQHKQRINAYRRPCPEQDSNARSQCTSGRRQFMP
jgi:hypothetical protein